MTIKRFLLHGAVAAVMAAAVAAVGVTPAMASPSAEPAASVPIYALGTVQSGVQLGCTILATSYGIQYVLIGGDSSVVRPGARVLVYGNFSPTAATTCLQGYELQVISAQLF